MYGLHMFQASRLRLILIIKYYYVYRLSELGPPLSGMNLFANVQQAAAGEEKHASAKRTRYRMRTKIVKLPNWATCKLMVQFVSLSLTVDDALALIKECR